MAGKIKVALLFGGRSAEHEVSQTSAKSIHSNLDKAKFDITSIYINKEGKWRIVDSPFFSPEEGKQGTFYSFLPWLGQSLLQAVEADIFFPILHGPYGEDGTIQGFFEMAGVPYVGAGVLASALGMDKAVSKTLFCSKNLPVVKHLVILEKDWREDRKRILARIEQEFSLPLFAKPSNLGSSVGISKVKDYGQAEQALLAAFQYDRKILVEEGIRGRELECSVLGNDDPQASLPGEIIPCREFYDYQDKYIEGKTGFGIPAQLPPSIIEEIQRISIEAFRAVDCSGMARVDFFLQDGTQKLFLSEINTIPGFTEISMYPKLWEVSGLPFPELLETLVELGLQRFQMKKRKVSFKR